MSWHWNIWLFFMVAITVLPEAHGIDSSGSQLSDLPSCALGCVQDALENSSCSLTNLTCICTELLGADLSPCILGSCTIKESLTTQNVTTKACNIAPRHPPVSYNAIIISFTIISTIFVGQRVVFRIHTKIKLDTDDYLILIALIASIPLTVIGMYGLDANGLGRDVWTIPITSIYKFGKYFMIEALLYFLIMALIKLALLFFYLRIFPFTPISHIIWGTIAFCILQGLIIIFVTIFLCQPISYFWEGWDGEHTGRCLSNRAIAWANAVIGIALDIWMLGIPLSQLRVLNLTWRKKVAVGAMFFVGTFVTVVSIIRLSALVYFPASSPNSTWDYFGASVWSIVEVHVGILCTCMPTVRLFLVRLFPALSTSVQQPSSNDNALRVPSGRKTNGDQKGAAQMLSVCLNLDKPGSSQEGDYDRMLAADRSENDETELIHMREF